MLVKFLHPFAVGALIAALLLGSPSTGRAAPPPSPQKVTSVEGVTEYRFENGFRVLLYPDPSTPKVSVINTVFVGARHEGYGETGMAHLLEHMNFRGTPTHKDVKKLLSERGGDYGATTTLDQTWYHETLAGTDENLEFAIRLEADRLVNSLLEREALASEMTVVRNEFEMNENNPHTILTQRVMSAAYEWHNYGRPVIGNRSDIERVAAEPLRAFYQKHYRPDNAMLIVAGKFDEQKALGYAARYFGALKNPAGKLDRPKTEEPAQDGERTVTLRRVGTTGLVELAYHVPAAAHPDHAPLAVLAQVLGTEPRGRLYKALIAAKKSSSVAATAWQMHDPGPFFIAAQVDRGGSPDEIRRVLLDVVNALGTDKVTADEVRTACAELTNGWHLKSSHTLADELRAWAGCGDWRLLFYHRDRLEKVTADDVNRVAAKYLVRHNRTEGTYTPTEKPERADVPRAPDLAEVLKDYKGSRAIAAGEEFDPTPENIEQRLRHLTLKSGVKASLLPRKTRGETVILKLALRYGDERSLAGLSAACRLLPEVMLHGTREYDFAALDRELVKLDNAGIVATGELGAIQFLVQCKRQHVPQALKLLGAVLREPTFPKDEFETLRRAKIESLRGALKDPESLAVRALVRKLQPHPRGDVRYTPTIEEAIARYEAVTLEQVRKVYTEQLGGTSGELAVVGDFDPEPTVRQVQELLDGWKTGTPYQRIASAVGTRTDGGTEVINTPDKENAVYLAGHMLTVRDTDPDYPALMVGNYILGNPMASRLWDRVREKDGLSYSVQSIFSPGDLDPVATLEFVAICNPANMPKVRRAMTEEIERLLKSGVTREELDAAKTAILTNRRTFTDAEIVAKLMDDLFTGDSFKAFAGRSRKVRELTVEDVNAALRKHIDPKKLVVVEAGDFRPAEKSR
ncbi:peptidase m16 domain-containing protein : Peptidase M16 domain protein OS=Planctomyces limnophilus (strain ATCC 43296 / DSM 3776 / IFAM 1008 / 290) GN=Plim_0240 PE=3 SV=1: Peptidase_M16: Peptidase_M16_C: Peptidase_M16_C [Gemmata massiliana]|uniref:Peptidase M16 C-terminal domain-containing protein n=1 Tax=Gemmata massiliana TaxID=1210884 RepID=A0A6P2CX95_9BACT|nr:pitrilysin family protein [Gemmata massiliana]VTR92765.1 peptidase m16 domain-containing protein : Peptidase M16 domain protein OS=Planctomyces limnophilus (strain ATCC 43296 / DSM 3776 / IFAM 1008 / 290) GN=Plim_0240 PE=3 SV=1: Peptidase_M16: Peptidase_M16_C: Peptidase_M16_C [Gemmata massiliana]